MKKYIVKIQKYIAAQIFFDMICVICAAVAPLLQEWVFDYGPAYPFYVILCVLFLYLLLLCLSAFTSCLGVLFSFKGAVKFERLLKRAFFQTIAGMSDSEFHARSIGEYISFQANDLTALEQDYLQPLIDIIKSVNMLLIYGAVLFFGVDGRICLIIMTATILSIVFSRMTDRPLIDRRGRYQRQMGDYTVKITDLLLGFRLINRRTCAKITEQHENALAQTAQKRYDYGKMKSLAIGVSELCINNMRFVIFAAIVILLYYEKITVGVAVAALSYISAFVSPIDSILYDISTMQSTSQIREKFRLFIKEKAAGEKADKKALESDISLEHVFLERDFLHVKDWSCKIEKGKKYAIAGPSGAGKSTFIKMLLGLIEPDAGKILIDGADVRRLELSELISYVDQNEHIFQSGVIENVTVFGSYSPIHLRETLQRYDLKRLNQIWSREDAVNCQKMSGGEKQMIAFLRVLAENTDVVIMDEPFSAMDHKTYQEMEEFIFLSEEFRGKTVLTVTHRADEKTLGRYDAVIRIADGVLKVETRESASAAAVKSGEEKAAD